MKTEHLAISTLGLAVIALVGMRIADLEASPPQAGALRPTGAQESAAVRDLRAATSPTPEATAPVNAAVESAPKSSPSSPSPEAVSGIAPSAPATPDSDDSATAVEGDTASPRATSAVDLSRSTWQSILEAPLGWLMGGTAYRPASAMFESLRDLEKYKGALLVNFWFPKCLACRAELDEVLALKARHPDLQIVFIWVKLKGDDQGVAALEQLMKRGDDGKSWAESLAPLGTILTTTKSGFAAFLSPLQKVGLASAYPTTLLLTGPDLDLVWGRVGKLNGGDVDDLDKYFACTKGDCLKELERSAVASQTFSIRCNGGECRSQASAQVGFTARPATVISDKVKQREAAAHRDPRNQRDERGGRSGRSGRHDDDRNKQVTPGRPGVASSRDRDEHNNGAHQPDRPEAPTRPEPDPTYEPPRDERPDPGPAQPTSPSNSNFEVIP